MRMRRVQPRRVFVLPKDRRDRGERERKDDARQKDFSVSRLPLLPRHVVGVSRGPKGFLVGEFDPKFQFFRPIVSISSTRDTNEKTSKREQK
jgi:hypothetical protein